jgi:hypothetical protein
MDKTVTRIFLIGVALAMIAVGPTAENEIRLQNVDGDFVAPLAADPAVQATVALFVRTDCPISNRYAPEVRRIHETYSKQGVAFWLIYPDPTAEDAAIRTHLAEYNYPMPALKDPEHRLVGRAEAKITPEAAVFDADGKLVYLGRIDDRYVDFGKTRPEPTRHDLELALDSLLAGRPIEMDRTKAIGCFIEDLR